MFQESLRSRSEVSQESVRSWSGVGQESVRSWSGVVQELVRTRSGGGQKSFRILLVTNLESWFEQLSKLKPDVISNKFLIS